MSAKDTEAIVAEQHEIDSDEDIDDDDNWNEIGEEQEPAKCLFCDEIGSSIEKTIEHLDQLHYINLGSIKTKFNLDQYSYIKMINYIKSHKLSEKNFKEINEILWNDEKYMKPVEIDPWLMFDIEGLKESQLDVTTNDLHKIESLELKLKKKDDIIEQLLDQINQMKTSFHTWVDRTGNGPIPNTSSSENEMSDKLEVDEQTHVAKIPIQLDESYFTSYAHFDVHYDMLSDTVRTSSYRDAILRNRNLFENKLVMDVGCGTAILSMFSSQAGAKKVIAVDQSEIIYYGMDIAQRNNITNIEFAKGRLENISLPLAEGEKVDIIVSEWMGYFLLFEGMLDSIIHAREKYLKPGGLLLPNRCTINLLGIGDEERHGDYIDFWNDVYGFDMGIMQSNVLKEAIVETCRSEHILSNSVVIADLNMHQVDYTYPNFTFDFELKIQKSGKFTAFVGYFDTFFDLPQSVEFTTGPHSKSTHWKQVVFYLKNPVPVNEGDTVRGQFHCNRGKKDARALCIKIIAFNDEFHYSLN